MTLDDLRAKYESAFEAAALEDDATLELAERAGIRAVVEALRDEMTLGWEDDRPWGDVADVKKFLNKILASDGEEAAGAPTRKDGEASQPSPYTPAADLVCVWTRRGDGLFFIPCDHRANLPKPQQQVCQYCNRPIKFKEGSE